MPLLDKAIELAARVHAGQKDKFGEIYILHPIRVMMRLDSELEKTVAMLHDVVEDCDITLDDLRNEGFTQEIVDAVDCLSKREGEEYFAYIERVKTNPLAIKVKLADLEDNSDVTRSAQYMQSHEKSLGIYYKAWVELRNYLYKNY